MSCSLLAGRTATASCSGVTSTSYSHLVPLQVRCPRNYFLHTRPSRLVAQTLVRSQAPEVAELSTLSATATGQPADTALYTRRPCSTPCDSNDARCLQLEALLQNVLRFPRIPPRVFKKYCEGAITADIAAIEDFLIKLEAFLGRELTLYLIRNQPYLLNCDFPSVKARHDELQRWLGLRPGEMILVLKKNPTFLVYDIDFYKNNFNALKRLLPFSPEQFHALVKKYPPILNWRTENIKRRLDYLRSLCSTREMWQENFDYITPSLLAFYLKDAEDLNRRLEFLVVTGLSPKCQLREVFKPSNNLFARRYRGFRAWKKRVERDTHNKQQMSKQQMWA